MQTRATFFILLAGASLALAVSVERPAAAYTPFINPVQGYYTWNAAAPVRWMIEPGAPPTVREAMQAVTQSWAQATGGALAFEEGPGGMIVEWDVDGSRIVDTLYLAYTYFKADGANRIVGATVTINALSYTWHRGGYTGVGPLNGGKRDANLDSVLLHEIGHALGLDHSDKNPAAIVGAYSPSDLPTMNSVIYPGAETLHSDDEAGIRALYATHSAAPAQAQPGPAILASPLSGKAPLTVSFSTSDGSAALWDFGTGNGKSRRGSKNKNKDKRNQQESGADISHKFTAPGTYTISATANGQTDTITITVEKKGRRARRPKRQRRK